MENGLGPFHEPYTGLDDCLNMILFVAIFVLWIASFSSAVLLGVTASVIVTLRDARSDFLLIITSGIIIGFVVGIHVGSEIYNEWLESETRI